MTGEGHSTYLPMYGLEGQPIGPEEGVRLLGSVDERKVANDEVGNYRVSTVCLVIDHNWGGGPPLIFETMIFGDGPLDKWQRRYSTPKCPFWAIPTLVTWRRPAIHPSSSAYGGRGGHGSARPGNVPAGVTVPPREARP